MRELAVTCCGSLYSCNREKGKNSVAQGGEIIPGRAWSYVRPCGMRDVVSLLTHVRNGWHHRPMKVYITEQCIIYALDHRTPVIEMLACFLFHFPVACQLVSACSLACLYLCLIARLFVCLYWQFPSRNDKWRKEDDKFKAAMVPSSRTLWNCKLKFGKCRRSDTCSLMCLHISL